MRFATRYPGPVLGFGGPVPSGVKLLLISNIALFLAYFFVVRVQALDWLQGLFDWLRLWPRAVLELIGLPQLFTYMFLHDPYGLSHILFNMLALWMFGGDLERSWGRRRFLQYYFACGAGAGLCAVAGNWMFGSLDSRTIGASGAIYGILLAFGLMFPDATVLFSLLFPIKAKYFVMIMGAIAFLGTMGSANSGVSHVAHLGGMVFGYAYLKLGFLHLDALAGLRRSLREWKQRRARRKFEVYMRKGSGKDRMVH